MISKLNILLLEIVKGVSSIHSLYFNDKKVVAIPDYCKEGFYQENGIMERVKAVFLCRIILLWVKICF